MKYFIALLLFLIPSALGAPIKTNVLRVDTVKEQLKDTSLEIQSDFALPVELSVKEIRGKSYTQGEYDQIRLEMAGKVKTFQNATSTTDEERAIIFDLINQCKKPIGNVILNLDTMNEFIAQRMECL